MYLIVDSRLPHLVDYWPAFQPWWASREQLGHWRPGIFSKSCELIMRHVRNKRTKIARIEPTNRVTGVTNAKGPVASGEEINWLNVHYERVQSECFFLLAKLLFVRCAPVSERAKACKKQRETRNKTTNKGCNQNGTAKTDQGQMTKGPVLQLPLATRKRLEPKTVGKEFSLSI